MEKVKITREQADAIDEMFRQGIDNKCKIIELHVKEPNGWADHCIPLRNMSLDDLIRAVYIGYEVEETPEDKVRKLYDYFDQDGVAFAGADVRNKIARILTMLDIPIAGVNHE